MRSRRRSPQWSSAHIVKIDVDKPCEYMREYYANVVALYTLVAGAYNLPRIVGFEVMCSQSGNTHAVIILERRPRDCLEYYAVQALLGNDPMRSILNYARCVNLGDAIDILFARKERLERGGDSGETG